MYNNLYEIHFVGGDYIAVKEEEYKRILEKINNRVIQSNGRLHFLNARLFDGSDIFINLDNITHFMKKR